MVWRWLRAVRRRVREQVDLAVECAALRHQVAILQRSRSRHPRFGPWDRLLWACLSRYWLRWREALVLVQAETVLRWDRQTRRPHAPPAKVSAPQAMWSTENRCRDSRPDQPYGARQCALGRITHPRRIAEAWFQRLPGDSITLYQKMRSAKVSGVAELSSNPAFLQRPALIPRKNSLTARYSPWSAEPTRVWDCL
jgi:hypothetical protein